MNLPLNREILLLEQHLIEEFVPWKRDTVTALLATLDQITFLASRLFSPERLLGIEGDPTQIVQIAAKIKTRWQHIQIGLNPTEHELLMKLLTLREVSVSADRLLTPRGQFVIE